MRAACVDNDDVRMSQAWRRKSLNFRVPCAAFLEHWRHSSNKDDMNKVGNIWEIRLSKEDC
jgi:hypothetical protein